MKIGKLCLKNFRNYSDEEIIFSENINMLYGENAQGKTNIIEALYIMATGKSHRTNNMNELIKYGETFFCIFLEFEDNNYEQSIEIRYEKGKRKELRINEVKKEKISDLLGVVPSVIFAPESLLSVKGSPGERRRLIDIILCQMNKKYLVNLQKYNRIIKNKNVLLKKIQVKKQHADQLDIWNEAQAESGSKIIEERRYFVRNIEKRMKLIINEISGGKETVSVKYKSFNESEQPVFTSLYDIIKKNKEKEIEYGSCLYGPHRDDMEIYINKKNSRMYCSQGQQRSVALSLNIAILEEIEKEMERSPLLLLDDVMSELDEKRQKVLLSLIKKRQTIITATEKIGFNDVEEKKIYFQKVEHGKVYID